MYTFESLNKLINDKKLIIVHINHNKTRIVYCHVDGDYYNTTSLCQLYVTIDNKLYHIRHSSHYDDTSLAYSDKVPKQSLHSKYNIKYANKFDQL